MTQKEIIELLNKYKELANAKAYTRDGRYPIWDSDHEEIVKQLFPKEQ